MATHIVTGRNVALPATATFRVEEYVVETDSYKLVNAYYEYSDAFTVADIERRNDPEKLIRVIVTLDY